MAMWTVDLTTQDGAESATQQGGLACFLAAGMSVLGAALMLGGFAGLGGPDPVLSAIGAGLEALFFVIAGFRLRAGKGMIWGSVAALVILVELAGKLLAFSVVGIFINVAVLIGMINGVRGAIALRRGDFDAEDAAAVFE